MVFPKPSFDTLIANYQTDPESVHDCRFIHSKNPVNVNTCAIRMGEALVIANGLVASREAIAALTDKAGDGRTFLLGRYDYPALLCPHGVSRGAGDVATFLRRQWGEPDKTWTAQAAEDAIPDDARGLRGVLAFEGIPGYSGQGHMDLWDENGPAGHQYWNAGRIDLWVLC
jgi:hypothetical protein